VCEYERFEVRKQYKVRLLVYEYERLEVCKQFKVRLLRYGSESLELRKDFKIVRRGPCRFKEASLYW
jgi:hypothetical protein